MLGFIFLNTVHNFRAHRLLQSNPKFCCFIRGPAPIMLISLIFLSLYLMSRNSVGRHHFAAAYFTNSSSSKASFLLSTGSGVVRFSPGEPKSTLLAGLPSAVHLDYLFLPQLQKVAIFWTDTQENRIYRAFLEDNQLVKKEVVVNHGILSLNGLAVDWMRSVLYWVDQYSQHIEVCTWDGSMRTVLLEGVAQASGLLIDPVQGWLFWIAEHSSENGSYKVIERSSLDGMQQQVVVTSSVPSTADQSYKIALFPDKQELYWLDSLTGSLHCSNYDGSAQRFLGIIPKSKCVFGLTVTKDYFYWTDQVNRVLVKASRQNLDQAETLTITHPNIYDLKLLNVKHNQSGDINAFCDTVNGGCSHLCLEGINGPTCKCPYGLELAQGQHTCQDHGPILGYALEDKPDLLFFSHINNTASWVFPPISVRQLESSSLAFDPSTDRVFRIEDQNIICQSMDGKFSETVLSMGYFWPSSLVMDWQNDILYILSEWDRGKGLVSAATANGSLLTHLHWENIWTPEHLAIDELNRFLFWSHVQAGEKNTSLTVLEMSDLDGSKRKLFYHALESIKAMTPDPLGRQLCWLNPKVDLIMCRKYRTSSSVYSLPVGNQDRQFTALSVYHQTLFYGNGRGELYTVDLPSNNRTAVALRNNASLVFLHVIPSRSEKLKRHCCGSVGICLRGYGECTRSYKKVDEFLLYIEESVPHMLPLQMLQDYPDLLPRPLFSVQDGDKVDVLPGPNSYLFWVDKMDGDIYSVRRDGKNQSKVISMESGVGGIAIDHVAGNLYWSIPTKAEIWVSRIDGKHPFIVQSGVNDQPSVLDVSSEYGFLFWLSCGQTCGVSRSSLSGLDYKILLLGLTSDTDLDVDGSYLYWSSPDLGIIERSDLNGNGREVMLKSDMSFSPYSLAVERNVIYWTDRRLESGNIFKMNDSRISLLRSGTVARKILIVNEDNSSRSHSENPCRIENGGCSHLCLFSGNGHSEKLCYCSHGRLASNGKDCEEYSRFLMYSDRNKMETIRIDDPLNPNPPFKVIRPFPSKANIVALVYNPTQDRIYFNDLYRKPYLFSIFLNGSGLRPELNESDHRTRHIEGLALDSIQGLLLWTESSSPSVWSLSPQQNPKRIMTLSPSDRPRGIVLHYCSRRLFWTNWNLQHPGIETCILGHCNASHKKFLSTNSQHPNALALHEARLFWSVTSPKTNEYAIHSCQLDGTEHRVHVQGRDANPFALVVLSSNQDILWTDFERKKLCRADHVSGCQPVKENLDRPLGLTLVDLTHHSYDCMEKGDLTTALLEYGCINNMCNGTENLKPSFNFTNNLVEARNEYTVFHKNLFIGASVAATCLIALTVLLVLAIVYRRKKEKWSYLKAAAQRARTLQERSYSNCGQTNSLLELDDVSSQTRDEKMDNEDCMVLCK